MSYDAIVVGVGGMGSATVYELARRGRSVLGIERFDIPHDRGSSHGINRIIRLAYYEDPAYVPLLHRAYQLWRELEGGAGEQLLHITGSIDAGREDEQVFAGSRESCVVHAVPHEVLDHDELARRYPGYELPPGHKALLQEDGGFLLSERCIVRYVEAAQELGAEVHAREQVLEWSVDNGKVTVRTDRGSYQAEQIIVTAGPWAGRLLPQLSASAQPERQVLGWFQPLAPALFAPARFPVFNLLVDEGRYYGFPVYGIPGFKIGCYHHLHEQVDADTINRDIIDRDEQLLRACVGRYFPQANGPTMTLKTCMFTNSPDEHFIVGRKDELLYAAGFSGHGFKFCSVIGEILAELATSGTTRHDISLFDPARLQAAG